MFSQNQMAFSLFILAFYFADSPVLCQTVDKDMGHLAYSFNDEVNEVSPESFSEGEEFLQVRKPTSFNYETAMRAYETLDIPRAILYFSKIPKSIVRKRGNPERDEYVRAQFYLGLSYQRLAMYEKAVGSYYKMLEYEHYSPIGHLNQAICFFSMSRYKRAEQNFLQVFRYQNFIDPSQYDDVMERARFFRALNLTKKYEAARGLRKTEALKQVYRLWEDHQAWHGKDDRFAGANKMARYYLETINYR